jgi:tetratricopeptide (TPR) repeat protein
MTDSINKKEITVSFSFDQLNGKTETFSEVNLDSCNDDTTLVTENLVNVIQKSLKSFFQTKEVELEKAIQNNSEIEFLENLNHFKVDNADTRIQIYSLVDQSLKIKEWEKSKLKILIRAGTLAENSKDFEKARAYFNQALKLKIDEDTRVAITLGIGNCYAKNDKLDSAINIYQSLLSTNLKKVNYSNIAWCHHNLGIAYIQSNEITKGVFHFKESAKIRSSNNESGEPFKTLGNLANSLELVDVHSAISLYDEISTSLECINRTNEIIRIIAHAFYGAARLRCLELGKYSDALQNINHALPLLQVFVEDRDYLAGALNIKILCLEGLNRNQEAEILKHIREEFLKNRPTLHSSLLDNTSHTNENSDLKWKFQILNNLNNMDELEENDLLFFIEEQTEILEQQKDPQASIILCILLNFYGQKLAESKKYSLALNYFSRAKSAYPSNIKNNLCLIQTLYNNENYADAIEISKDFISKNPEMYQGFMVLGLSANKISDYGLAEIMLEEALNLKSDLDQIQEILNDIKKAIREQRISGKYTPTNNDLIISPATHKLFLEYLQGFKSRTKFNSEAFWKSYANLEFIQNPENIGRALLAQDLNSGVKNVNMYKESILAGGRIDLIVNILGNEFIVELKMCGNGYSKPYAEGGFEQLKSYMTNRNATRSYLIVFDARVKQTGKDALPSEHDLGDGQIAFCIGIDIRSMK